MMLAWLAGGAISCLSAAPEQDTLGLGLPQPAPDKSSERQKVPASEVVDREGLLAVKSFCVDTSDLEAQVAAQIVTLLGADGRAGTNLNRLPWNRVGDCKTADAVVRFYFQTVNFTVREKSSKGVVNSSMSGQRLRPVLLLYDKTSTRLFYRAESRAFRGDADSLLAGPLAILAKDLRQMRRGQPESTEPSTEPAKSAAPTPQSEPSHGASAVRGFCLAGRSYAKLRVWRCPSLGPVRANPGQVGKRHGCPSLSEPEASRPA